MTSMESLSDDFTGTELDTGTWEAFAAGSATVSETSAGLTFSLPNGYPQTGGINSVTGYDLTGSSILVCPVATGEAALSGQNHATDMGIALQVNKDSTIETQNDLHIYLSARVIYVGYRSGGATHEWLTGGNQPAWDAANHAWWRISESGGWISWDTSPDGLTWTNRYSAANPFGVTGLTVKLWAHTWDTSATGSTLRFAHLNVPPGTPKSDSDAISAADGGEATGPAAHADTDAAAVTEAQGLTASLADAEAAQAGEAASKSTPPAVWTLFGQPTSGMPSAYGNPDACTEGLEFEVTESGCMLTEIGFWSGSGCTALPDKIGLYDAGTHALITSNTSLSWSGTAGSGWVKAAFSSPQALSTGTRYVAVVGGGGVGQNWRGGTYPYWGSGSPYATGPGTGGKTSGPISAPDWAGSLHGQNAYIEGDLVFPTKSDSTNYWLDIWVAAPAIVTDADAVRAADGGEAIPAVPVPVSGADVALAAEGEVISAVLAGSDATRVAEAQAAAASLSDSAAARAADAGEAIAAMLADADTAAGTDAAAGTVSRLVGADQAHADEREQATLADADQAVAAGAGSITAYASGADQAHAAEREQVRSVEYITDTDGVHVVSSSIEYYCSSDQIGVSAAGHVLARLRSTDRGAAADQAQQVSGPHYKQSADRAVAMERGCWSGPLASADAACVTEGTGRFARHDADAWSFGPWLEVAREGATPGVDVFGYAVVRPSAIRFGMPYGHAEPEPEPAPPPRPVISARVSLSVSPALSVTMHVAVEMAREHAARRI